MKTKITILIMLVFPLFFLGCQKFEVPEEAHTVQTQKAELKIEAEICGEATTFVFRTWEGDITGFGSGAIGNNEEYIYVSFKAPEDESIQAYALYIGTIDHLSSLGYNENIGDGTGEFDQSTFTIPPTFPDPLPTTLEFSFKISELPPLLSPEDCYIVVAVANFKNNITGETLGGYGYFPGLKSNGYYIDYCVQECEPPPSIGSETCFAYNSDYSYCFSEFDKKKGKYKPNGPFNKNFSRWGWTNGIEPEMNGTGGQGLEEGNYTFEIWAGAGQCDLTKGTLVGNLTIDYDGSTATVAYDMISGYVLAETHLYIGDKPIPTAKNGKATVAPGQYPYSDGDATTVEDDLVVYEINNLSGDIWVVAHGVAEDAQ